MSKCLCVPFKGEKKENKKEKNSKEEKKKGNLLKFGKFFVHRLWKWTSVKMGKKKEKVTEMVAKADVADASANSKSKL